MYSPLMSSHYTRFMLATDIEYLEERRDILAQMGEIQQERDVHVRKLLADGVPVRELVTVTGLTRARIYQIRDAGRIPPGTHRI